jgi:flagellar biosynthesis/type III secretory pathway M-ring protein FliF/YscJ
METIKYDSFNPSEFEAFQGTDIADRKKNIVLIIVGTLVVAVIVTLIVYKHNERKRREGQLAKS